MIINSEKAISQMKALGVPEADIRDLFRFRYNIDYDQTKTGRLFMMPERCSNDIEVLASGYPPAYLIGFVDFFHLKINVTPKVLIPRPETEELMEIIQNRQGRTLINSALDLCCGSGCIGLSLKKMFPGATVYASDISPYAMQMTQKNADENKLEVYIALSDYLEYFVYKGLKFDLIVSNPPYIKNGEILDSSLGFEPQEALFAGDDGLDSYRKIFASLPKVLNEHGVCYLEIEAANGDMTLDLVHQMLPAYNVELIKDLSNKDRFIRLTKKYL